MKYKIFLKGSNKSWVVDKVEQDSSMVLGFMAGKSNCEVMIPLHNVEYVEQLRD